MERAEVWFGVVLLDQDQLAPIRPGPESFNRGDHEFDDVSLVYRTVHSREDAGAFGSLRAKENKAKCRQSNHDCALSAKSQTISFPSVRNGPMSPLSRVTTTLTQCNQREAMAAEE